MIYSGKVDPTAPADEPEQVGISEFMEEQLERAKAGQSKTSQTGTETDSSTAGGKKKKKKKKKKKTKWKRKRDRFESQNFLLRIEGTLCCASIVIAFIWACSIFIALLIFLIWADFNITATTQSVKQSSSS
ncbi:unnamed protein product [Cylicostephanus goldi]|uniref:Uncharacterized protein n=1 Tax=Cylicostephanus goldi TaxID=71465 RepID=A0A3P6SWW3_CYLGO|nr:unnamed protein product [Cylicostephanus goldi]